MRVIIAGGRTFRDPAALRAAIAASGFAITVVVSGCAPGADRLGEAWARENGVPIQRFPADWRRFQRGAGSIRNEQMACNADALIALPGGRGTADMVARALAHGLELFDARGDTSGQVSSAYPLQCSWLRDTMTE